MVKNFNPVDMKLIKVTNTDQIDMIWNCFFATGDTQYARKNIDLCDENMADINSISIYFRGKNVFAGLGKNSRGNNEDMPGRI